MLGKYLKWELILYIYKTTNLITGKSYIGQHIGTNPNYIGSGVYFSRSVKKHGRKNFIKEILEYCDSKEELNEMETHYIIQYNTLSPNGYNLTLGGEGCDTTIRQTPEAYKERYEKLSQAVSGENHYLNKMSADERKIYIKENMGGNNHSTHRYKTEEEYKQYILENRCGSNNALQKGKTKEEFNTFINETYRGLNHYSAKFSKEEYKIWHQKQTSKTYNLTAETKKKMSVSQCTSELNNKRKIVVTLPFNDTELIIIGIGRFCNYINDLNILEYKVKRKIIARMANGELFKNSHKDWKAREFNEIKDINIPKWENTLYIDESSMEGYN